MVKGLKRLNRKLTRTIPDHVRKATRAAMEQGADEIVALAKQFVPVDSGALRDSIGWTWGGAPADTVVLVKSGETSGGESITIYAGSNEAFYARWIEFGRKQAPPSPFFYPAYRFKKRRVKGRITRAMKKAIKTGAK